MEPVQLLQIGSVVVLNASFSWMVGSLFARFWLRNTQHIVTRLRRVELAAVGLGIITACSALWASAAVMSGASLVDAGNMLPMMLTTTLYGQSGLFGLLCLLILMFHLCLRRTLGVDLATAVLLIGFAVSRTVISHAGENGMLSMGLSIELLHLLLIALWVGGVAIGGWMVLPMARTMPQQASAINSYLNTLSHAATIALIGIILSGIYNAWYRVGTLNNLAGNVYGTALLIKLMLVAVAVALGGFNKFFGFPTYIRSRNETLVIAILRVESLLLLGALIAAAILTSQQPPTAI